MTTDIIMWTTTRTHRQTGEIREYIDNWVEIIGIEIDYYKTGNIFTALLDGEKISNARAYELLNAKVWIDTEDEIHVERLSKRAAAVITADEIKNRIQKHIDAERAGE